MLTRLMFSGGERTGASDAGGHEWSVLSLLWL